jgi:hypothetical protein
MYRGKMPQAIISTSTRSFLMLKYAAGFMVFSGLTIINISPVYACPTGMRPYPESYFDSASQQWRTRVSCMPDPNSSPEPSNPAPAQPEVPNLPLNGAVVWWNDKAGKPGFSVAVQRLYSTQAEKDAMLHCRASGGFNCRLGFKFTKGRVAIARAADGSLYAAHERRKSEAKEQALNRCKASAGQSCEIVTLTDNEN